MKSESLSASETLSLLDRFTNGARAFAERERGLERARQLRESGRRREAEEARAAIQSRHAASVARLREESANACDLVEETLRRRRVRLDRGQITVRNQVVATLQASEGRQKAALQRDYMEAGRRREEALARAAATFAAEEAAAKAWHARFLKVEKAALSGLRGFGGPQRRLLLVLKEPETPTPGPADDASLEASLAALSTATRAFRKNPLVAWFSGFPLVLQLFCVLAIAGGAPFLASSMGLPPVSWVLAGGAGGGLVLLLSGLWFVARNAAVRFVEAESLHFAEAKAMRLRHRESVEVRHRVAAEEAEADFARVKAAFEAGMRKKASLPEGKIRYAGPEEVERRAGELRERLERLREYRIDSIHQVLAERIGELEHRRDGELSALGTGDGEEDPAMPLRRLVEEWRSEFLPLAAALAEEGNRSAGAGGEGRLSGDPAEWNAPRRFEAALPFGELDYRGGGGELVLPVAAEMTYTGPRDFRLPLRLRLPDAASILVETKQQGHEEAVRLLNYLVLGWLASSPPGRLSFSLIDPVGLGESFAGLMHLADYEEILINSRIRTQPDQIERRLGELCEHMEKVIQMYLRNDYATITDYNEAAGTIAERYHFLVVADFPHGFSDLAIRRLLSIAAAGARCGVFLLLHCDQRVAPPQGLRLDDLRAACLCLQSGLDGFSLRGREMKGATLSLCSPPAPERFARWVHRIGAANRDSNRIEVPFSHIAPAPGERWSLSTAEELRVPIGRSGATKLQYFALGKGTCQHALVAGKTGSGKSTLFHILVSNLALWFSPEEVEFYLIDFKKGVEFKCYGDHGLPHARVIAIESDREFGLSVLQRLDEELRRRGELFRAAGVQDVAGFRARPGAPPMPRTLLLIDEFQEFFTEDDAISQQAAVLLDRLVRQGRAFGIHAVLGSQTLGGAFTLARATLGQMTVRIALACNEADAYLIMDDSNPAPRLLTRPGEGIYNDRAGAAEANSPFQVVWLGEEERNAMLDGIAALDRERGGGPRDRVVFEGNAPGSVAEDPVVSTHLAGRAAPGELPRIFLGAPNSIKGPTEVVFARQSGGHLLFVGQREDAVDAIVAIALKTLRSRFGDGIRLVLVDSRFGGPDESPFRRFVESVGGVECPDAHASGSLVNELAAAMKAVAEGTTPGPSRPVVLFLPNLHRQRKLRHEEDYSFSLDASAEAKPSDSLQELILEGPPWGYHVVASLDSYNNVTRTLGRKAAGEFEKKVLFQMSAADSASLIDTGKAADLGLNRALFHDEPSGTVEIFRPFAMPGPDWF